MILESINKAGHCEFIRARPPASEEDIGKFIRVFGDGYDEYVNLVREGTYLEFFFSDTKRYARIIPPTVCIETYQVYEMENAVRDAVPIGDDRSGSCIYYGNGSNGRGLYLMDFGNMCQEDADWLAPSLMDFLLTGQGADKLR